jgi:hypothetical protein
LQVRPVIICQSLRKSWTLSNKSITPSYNARWFHRGWYQSTDKMTQIPIYTNYHRTKWHKLFIIYYYNTNTHHTKLPKLPIYSHFWSQTIDKTDRVILALEGPGIEQTHQYGSLNRLMGYHPPPSDNWISNEWIGCASYDIEKQITKLFFSYEKVWLGSICFLLLI